MYTSCFGKANHQKESQNLMSTGGIYNIYVAKNTVRHSRHADNGL